MPAAAVLSDSSAACVPSGSSPTIRAGSDTVKVPVGTRDAGAAEAGRTAWGPGPPLHRVPKPRTPPATAAVPRSHVRRVIARPSPPPGGVSMPIIPPRENRFPRKTLRRLLRYRLWVQILVELVAEQADRQDHQAERDPRDGRDPPRGTEVVASVGDHEAPGRMVGRRAEPEETE